MSETVGENLTTVDALQLLRIKIKVMTVGAPLLSTTPLKIPVGGQAQTIGQLLL